MGNDDVLGLDVPMRNLLSMQVRHALQDVPQFAAGIPLLENFLPFQLVVQSALFHVLQDEVDVVIFVENSIQFEHIGVVEVLLQLYFHSELGDHVILDNHRLLYLLEGVDRVGAEVAHQVNLPELALPQELYFLEVLHLDQVALAAHAGRH